MTDPLVLRLHDDDDVGVALRDVPAGSVLEQLAVTTVEDLARGHKVALRTLRAGQAVRKYGQVIGVASREIRAGAHVHIHNLATEGLGERAGSGATPADVQQARTERTFEGFRRDDGQAGTRNYVAVAATVNCSATVVRRIVDEIANEELRDLANVDGLFPLTHASGCGMPAGGEGLAILRRTLVGYLSHPNVGAALLVGLGCEVNDIRGLLESMGLRESDRLRTLAIQDAGGTRAAISAGADIVRELLRLADTARREPMPAAALTLGLQCGGSDAFSGITANPALGIAADKLVAAGGTVILGETPEIFGAEHLLTDRAASPRIAEALRERIDWWRQYAAMHGASLDNNPSPGNIAGGITTILEKSLGAVMKSGTTPLRAVVNYAQRVGEHGFVFMDSPGYDPCSVTGEIASGANIICFTTGRGSVFGAKPVPSLKLASNSDMARHMADDIDYDCGRILSGEKTLAGAGDDIFELLLATASGDQSRSESNGLGDFEFVPWHMGAVL